ncbi:TIGR03067 domain-containing protein [Frigoriglobus tundricola]|uniref:PDZ domain-containing protein n=1 Tax=Frigoriglobus tundricola TaxID=2774151 RepID=A0A6M5YNM7_9BACT|nr:TIGR03067 domain-containing protein [Frigoriglobus tundricola]QJW95699.1 hypothetical protein FTUN_3253 [Frigoriglobus tundricola]
MNRVTVTRVVFTVACGVLVASGEATRAADPPADPPAELPGCWKLVSTEANGKSSDPLGGGQPRWVVKGDKVFYGGAEIARFTADPSTTPRVLDLTCRDPERVHEGIYAVEKDTLKVCLNKRTEGAKDRPSQFVTKDQEDWVLLVFEREKAAPEDATEGLAAFAGVVLQKDEDKKAVVVAAPLKGSPAEKAGLKKGDAVLKVGATAATDLETAVKAVRAAKPGTALEFRIDRDGKEQTITVKVGVLPFHWVAGLG